eukprot:6816195-Pyramimonas_sp.AAC.1
MLEPRFQCAEALVANLACHVIRRNCFTCMHTAITGATLSFMAVGHTSLRNLHAQDRAAA